MDIKHNISKRTEEYTQAKKVNEIEPYDYAQDGILTKTLPKILFKSNPVLITFLQLIDLRCIMLFKYIDKLKKFKWISWY
jgi:hypothetical protein